MNGDFFPLKEAFSEYMKRWYGLLYPDTPGIQEFVGRGLARAIQWAPDRMVDQVEDMLKSYQKNTNSESNVPARGANALFPVVLLAMAKDYTPTGADFGGRQVSRRLVRLADPTDADPVPSVYGYRQAMGDIRTQVVIMAAESATARSLAAQFSLFVGEIRNRRFTVNHTFGQYTVQMPCMLESPDIMFSNIASGNSNMTILAADLTLKATIPYFDYPKAGEPNDGSTHNPPGYPPVAEVDTFNHVVLVQGVVTEQETAFQSFQP